MPFEIMDQRDASTPSGLFEEIHFLSEEKTSFWKPKTIPGHHEDAQPHQYADNAASYKVEEPLVATKEIEVQGIRNLLPDEDDLFSGITDKLRLSTHSDGSVGEEDFDLFCSGGDMELELDNCLNSCQENSNYTNGSFNGGRNSNDSVASKQQNPSGVHPYRTLFVRNINSNLEDSELRAVFEQYGDIQTLYTACKHRGFVIISYYDIRAAWNAMNSLQNKPLRHRNLAIHYSIPKDDPSDKDIKLGTLVVFDLDSSVSTEELNQIFGSFGEIKEIGVTLQYNKFIEFYDIRAAEAAYRALNRSYIAGKQIKLELSPPSGERHGLMQQFSPLLAQDESSHRGRLNDNSSSEQIEAFIATLSPTSMTSSCIHSGSFRGLHSKSQMSVGAFNENSFSQDSFSVPNSYPVRAATICNQVGLHEPIYSLTQGKSGNQSIPSPHLRSLPEYCEGSANVIPYNPFSTVADLAIGVGPRILEGTNDRHIYVMDSKGQQVEHQIGVFGSSWTSGCRLHGDHYVQSNSNSFQLLPTSPLVWPNSSPFVDGIHAHCNPNLPGSSRSSSHVLNIVSQTQQCHNGSAPAANLSGCNREHGYMGESSEVMGFNLESIGRIGFHSRSSDLAYHNLLHDGNHIGTFWNSALSSPQHASHIFPGVNLAASAPTSFCSTPKVRMRNLSNCRSEADSCQADRIKYELDINRVLRREDSRTTLMIKNIPNKYTSKMLLATIDELHRGTYDFIYLPIDFKNKCNMGYAFINMIDPLQILPFYKTFNGRKWEKFNSGKVASIAYARIQGKAALVAHFQNSSLMNEDKRCRPILFCTDGPNAGDQEPFPLGASIRSRSSKPRSSFNEDNYYQVSPSSFVRGDVISSGTNSLAGSVKDTNLEQTTNPMR